MATTSEPISLAKAAKAPFTALYWVKCVMFGLGIAFILFIGYAIYKAYLKKPAPTQDICVEQGGTVNIHQETKVNKHMFIPFAEVYTGREKNYDGFTYGIRVGARYELW